MNHFSDFDFINSILKRIEPSNDIIKLKERISLVEKDYNKLGQAYKSLESINGAYEEVLVKINKEKTEHKRRANLYLKKLDKETKAHRLKLEEETKAHKLKLEEETKAHRLKLEQLEEAHKLKLEEETKAHNHKLDEETKAHNHKLEEETKAHKLKLEEETKAHKLKLDEETKEHKLKLEEELKDKFNTILNLTNRLTKLEEKANNEVREIQNKYNIVVNELEETKQNNAVDREILLTTHKAEVDALKLQLKELNMDASKELQNVISTLMENNAKSYVTVNKMDEKINDMKNTLSVVDSKTDQTKNILLGNMVFVLRDSSTVFANCKPYMSKALQEEYHYNKYIINNTDLALSLMYYDKFPNDSRPNENNLKIFIPSIKELLKDYNFDAIILYDKSSVEFLRLIGVPPGIRFTTTKSIPVEGINCLLLEYTEILRYNIDDTIFNNYYAESLAALSDKSTKYYIDNVLKFPIPYDKLPGTTKETKLSSLIMAYAVSKNEQCKKFLPKDEELIKFCDNIRNLNYNLDRISVPISILTYIIFRVNINFKKIPAGVYDILVLVGNSKIDFTVKPIKIKLNNETILKEVLSLAQNLVTVAGNKDSAVDNEIVYFVLYDMLIKTELDNKTIVIEDKPKFIDRIINIDLDTLND